MLKIYIKIKEVLTMFENYFFGLLEASLNNDIKIEKGELKIKLPDDYEKEILKYND